jgi:hypothetical protein
MPRKSQAEQNLQRPVLTVTPVVPLLQPAPQAFGKLAQVHPASPTTKPATLTIRFSCESEQVIAGIGPSPTSS